MESQSETTQTVSGLKLLEVIVNGVSVSPIASASVGAEGPIHPKTTEQKLARKKELKAKSTLMLAISDEHLLKFHDCKDANSLWEAIKNRCKGKSSSSSNSQNVAFVSSDNSSSTNETVNTAHSVSAASSKDQASTASYADDVMFSFFANQSNAPQLDYEDLEQIDADDLEEMDLKWQVAMLTMRVKRFIKKTGRKIDLNDKETVSFDMTKVECYNCHRRGHFARECRAPRNQGNRNRDAPRRNALVDTSTTNALVVQDGIGGYDWSFQAEEGITNFALMAYTSQGSSSSDSEREALNKSNLEIIGYQMGLESLEARIVVHEKNEAVYEEDIAFLNAKDKTGLGYDSQSEVVHSVFNSRESNVDDSLVNDRFKTGERFHAIPPPYTRNYMPSRPDLSFAGLDDSVYKTKEFSYPAAVATSPKSKCQLMLLSKALQEQHHQLVLQAPDTNNKTHNTTITTKHPTLFNTTTPKTKVNNALPITYSYFKAHSLVRRAINQKPAAKTNNFNEKVNTARVNNVTTAGPKVVVSAAKGNGEMLLSPQHAGFRDQQEMLLTITPKTVDHTCLKDLTMLIYKADSRSPKGGKITRKGKIRTGKLDFEDVYFVKELKFNLFSISQMYDKKNSVLFTKTECLVLSPDFKLLDESQVLLKVPRHDNMYSFDLKNVVPSADPIGKFDGKVDKGFLVGYSINSKAFRVFNTRTRKVEDNMHITFLENKPNVARSIPDWLIDIDLLTNSMNYEPVTAGNQTNKNAGIKDKVDAVPTQQYILLPLFYDSPQSLEDAIASYAGKKTNEKPTNEGERNGQEKGIGASNKEGDKNVKDFRAELDNLLV
ncbi:ribonuclease H-like domain-containing protein [Tanacetum coccineum]